MDGMGGLMDGMDGWMEREWWVNDKRVGGKWWVDK